MKKKFFIRLCLTTLLFVFPLSPASAAEKVTAVKCTATKAVGHSAKVMALTQKPLSKFPRTFTLTTNCGTIVITTVGNNFAAISRKRESPRKFRERFLC